MTAFRKYFNLILVTAVFAALLMLFKFGVVEPAYTPISENPCRYGEMFGPVSCLKNWVYGFLVLGWGVSMFLVWKTCGKKADSKESDFYGDAAIYYFLYPEQSAVEKINTLLKGLPTENSVKGIDNPEEPETLSLDETAREIEKWLWESYADELLDLKAGEESLLAGYFVFVYDNVLSIQICYMTEWPGGAIFFGVDAARCDTDVFKVWIPDINHSADEISAELTSVKAAICNGSWQDPCCALKEQVTVWAKEKNITV